MNRFDVPKIHTISLFSLVLLLVCVAVCAQTFSHIVSFQGRLAAPDTGKPLPDGQYEVMFRIYDAETDGNNLWQETQNVTVAGGLFTVHLGAVTPFPSDLFAGGDRWLAIEVVGDPEMPERIRFAPTPWAIYAADSDKVDGRHADEFAGLPLPPNCVSSETIVDGQITTDDLANDAVTVDELADNIDATGIGFNADKVDGYDAGNQQGQVAVSNGTLCQNLNAEKLNGKTESDFVTYPLAPDCVYSENIVDDEIISEDIKNYTITGYDIANNAIGIDHMRTGSVGSDEIIDGSIQFVDIARPLYVHSSVDPEYFEIRRDDVSDSYRVLRLQNYSCGRGDCFHAYCWEDCQDSSTWCIHGSTKYGQAGHFYKDVAEGEYAVEIFAPSYTNGLYVRGNFVVENGTKDAVIETSRGRQAIYCIESPDVDIYASGTARLQGGEAHVEFDWLFQEAISDLVPVRVVVTPVGSWSALYLSSADSIGFHVLSGAGDATAEFNWVAVGRRKGYEERPVTTFPDVGNEAGDVHPYLGRSD